MLESDDCEFYIGEHQKEDQHEESAEIRQNCALIPSKKKFKLVKIVKKNNRPHLHFEIDGKMFFYGIVGVRANNQIVIKCTSCKNFSYILPSEFLWQIMQYKPGDLKLNYPKMFDYSDPKVYDIQNYDIDSFDIGRDSTIRKNRLVRIIDKHIQ